MLILYRFDCALFLDCFLLFDIAVAVIDWGFTYADWLSENLVDGEMKNWVSGEDHVSHHKVFVLFHEARMNLAHVFSHCAGSEELSHTETFVSW